jgi:glycosyltransferase involved in cell wall biosynthesis
MRNGGIGTYNWLMAHLLAGQGWKVHVLYCGHVRRKDDLLDMRRRLAEAGIGWSYLGDFDEPESSKVPGIQDIIQVYLSERVRHALEEVHREHHFDLIEFAEWGALGFRSVQARRAGLAFDDVLMAVRLHSSSQWMREGNRHWLADPAEIEVDYCERYAFEHADVQISPCRYMFDYARRIGWNVRSDARVIPYPYPSPQFVPAAAAGPTDPEIVFFGRLETRKGLEVFVRAVGDLDPRLAITFLGRVNVMPDGRSALEYLRSVLADRRYKLMTDCNREQALAYLAGGNRLAVMPSLSDNCPFTVIECAVNGIPFLASRVGGVPELLPDPVVGAGLLFEPNARDLARCLTGYLAAWPAERAELRERARRCMDVADNNRRAIDGYRDLLANADRPAEEGPERLPSQAAGGASTPLVTVAIAHYNLGKYLPETLASLAEQTYPNLEVLVIDDGSTDPHTLEVLTEQQARYPHFRFLSHPNAGIGATRNRGLAEARGEFFIPMDADNVACPHMVERFVAALRRNPELSAVTCYCLAFKEAEDIAEGNFSYAYRPTGGPHVLASIKNIYGDANAIFRTAAFRAVGGYETDRDCSWEDLEAFVKLVNAGHKIDTLPEHLFYYRHLDTGFSRVTDTYLNQRRVLRQFFQVDRLPMAEGMALWTALISLQKRNEALALRLTSLRYRVADQVHSLFARVPAVKNGVKWLLRSGGLALHCLRPRTTHQQGDKQPLRTSA